MLRRQIFAGAAVFLTKSPALQTNLMLAQSLIMLLYLITVKPFYEPLMNGLEVFNEVCILAVTYPTLLFTGYFDCPPDLQYNAGWLMIIIVIGNTSINFFIAVWEAGVGFKKARVGFKIKKAAIMVYRAFKKYTKKTTTTAT